MSEICPFHAVDRLFCSQHSQSACHNKLTGLWNSDRSINARWPCRNNFTAGGARNSLSRQSDRGPCCNPGVASQPSRGVANTVLFRNLSRILVVFLGARLQAQTVLTSIVSSLMDIGSTSTAKTDIGHECPRGSAHGCCHFCGLFTDTNEVTPA